jgi:hypothetical protein
VEAVSGVNMKTVMFGKYGPIRTLGQSYDDGYKSGVNWKDNYRPGGPATYSVSILEKDNKDWAAYCDATHENRRAWFRGFDDGLQKQKAAA